MDAALTYRVADLALDQMVLLRCGCRSRSFTRTELARRVGLDARLSGIGLRRELWCAECDEPSFEGSVVIAPPGHTRNAA
jgi:hypothetical protein